jgi:DNA topoisomerase-3
MAEQTDIKRFEQLKCPICGKPLIRLSWGVGCTGYSKEKDGCNFSISIPLLKCNLTYDNIKELVETGETANPLSFTSKKTKRKFEARLALEGKNIKFIMINAKGS